MPVSSIDTVPSVPTCFGGPDRITLTANDAAAHNGTTVNRSRVFAWAANQSSASNLVATTESSANGLTSWNITWNNNGAQGVTNKTVTTYGANGTRTVTSTAPDGSSRVSAYQYGQLMSTALYDANNAPIGGTSYGYDQFGRQSTATDARTQGTTT